MSAVAATNAVSERVNEPSPVAPGRFSSEKLRVYSAEKLPVDDVSSDAVKAWLSAGLRIGTLLQN